MNLKFEFPTNNRSPHWKTIINQIVNMDSYRTWMEDGAVWHTFELSYKQFYEYRDLIKIVEHWKTTKVWFHNKPYCIVENYDPDATFYDLYNYIHAINFRETPHEPVCLSIKWKDLHDLFIKTEKEKISKARTPQDLFRKDDKSK